MRIKNVLLPSLALGAAALLLAPSPETANGFNTAGFGLSISQRDFRIFNNFADAGANNNTLDEPNFPGYDGAVVAIWKGAVEWGSELHGDGNDDPHQNGGLGSGGANFDAHFQGEATAVGGLNDNVHSETSSCGGGGVLAFTESPSSNGWRIRYCGEINYKDGPGTSIGSGIDLQGVACHEYGHSLGLNHTNSSGATMTAFIQGNGVPARSIASDDINGVKAIYGAKSASKPRNTSISINSGSLTITGSNFSSTGNEVRFTQKAKGGNGNPVTVSNVNSTSNGTKITVNIPSAAGPGDLLVKKGGSSAFSSLSNAFPIDPGSGGGGPSGGAPTITALTPSVVKAVNPAGQKLTITGTGFTGVTDVFYDGIKLFAFPPEYSVVNDTTIVINSIPLADNLGNVPILVKHPQGDVSKNLTVVVNNPPALDLLNSNPSFLFNGVGADVVMGSKALDTFFLAVSPDLIPSVLPGIVNAGIGNNFTTLLLLGTFVPDAGKGYIKVNFPFPKAFATGTKLNLQAGVLDFAGNLPLVMTNIESGTILL